MDECWYVGPYRLCRNGERWWITIETASLDNDEFGSAGLLREIDYLKKNLETVEKLLRLRANERGSADR